MKLTFAIPRDDDRLAADVAGDVVVVVGDVALMSKIDPVPLPDVLHLQLEQLEVREDAATAAEDASLGVISTEASRRSITLSDMGVTPLVWSTGVPGG